MERHSQQPSQRMQDRSMSHTPAQQPPPSNFSAFHPATAQPPIQMPFSDPFQNRDPFMPASQQSRRGSYGIMGPGPASAPSSALSAYGERAWSAQPSGHQNLAQPQQQQQQNHRQSAPQAPPPPPPPPSSAHNPSAQMSYGYDPARRRSIGGNSPPRYATGPLEPPPPPPSFATLNMPPPSPTSASAGPGSFPVPASRNPPPPYVGGRDLPSFGSRPGASMSISSLIGGGGGGGDTSRHGNHSPRTSATAPSPTIKPLHPPSPQRARSASIRTEQAQYPRPPSPIGMMHAARPNDTRPVQVPYAQSRAPHDYPAATLPPSHPLHHPSSSVQGFRHFQSSPTSAQGDDGHGYGFQAPMRPNSQPLYPDADVQQRRDLQDRSHFGTFRPFAEQSAGRGGPISRPPSRPNTGDRVERMPEPVVNGHNHHATHNRAMLSPRMSQTARSTPAPASQAYPRGNYGTPLREDYTGLFRPAFHPYPSAPPNHVVNGGREDLDPRGPRNEPLGRAEGRQSPPSDAWQYESRQRLQGPHYASMGVHAYDAPPHEQHPRREEESHVQRAFLGVSPDMARKNGRNSPLPQAVQGAQPRRVGPGGDPSIKSEFGRMFSGLGSGIGSNTPTAGMSANGAATPSRMSPTRQVEGSEGVLHAAADTEPLHNGKNGFRGAKKGRKIRDEAVRADSESADGRNTPTLSQRGNKRPKTTHPAHHHHHHPHTHHHHHHHHNIADDQVPTPFNTLRFPSNPTVPQPAAHHHHHHHAVHSHAAHHHHHTPKPVPAPRTPTISVSNQALLASVSSLPRKHLGSQLYATKLGVPPRESTPLDAKFHFRSTMKPIPRFESKQNCTFTVRVPRAYFRSSDTAGSATTVAGGLEEICRTRSLWGTDVYTDDSDTVAAAVHSGWLLGDFGEYNEDIHDLFDPANDDIEDLPQIGKPVTLKPKSPIRPLANADLHITLLILPALTHYAASTQNNLRSREWGTDHDGMSYMIHSLEFVDESRANRLCERNGAAKHQRIREELDRQKEAAESLLGLLRGGPSVSIGA